MDVYMANFKALALVAGAEAPGSPVEAAYNGIPVHEWPRVVLDPAFAASLADVKVRVCTAARCMRLLAACMHACLRERCAWRWHWPCGQPPHTSRCAGSLLSPTVTALGRPAAHHRCVLPPRVLPPLAGQGVARLGAAGAAQRAAAAGARRHRAEPARRRRAGGARGAGGARRAGRPQRQQRGLGVGAAGRGAPLC